MDANAVNILVWAILGGLFGLVVWFTVFYFVMSSLLTPILAELEHLNGAIEKISPPPPAPLDSIPSAKLR